MSAFKWLVKLAILCCLVPTLSWAAITQFGSPNGAWNNTGNNGGLGFNVTLPGGGVTLSADTEVCIGLFERSGAQGYTLAANGSGGWTLLTTATSDASDKGYLYCAKWANGASYPATQAVVPTDAGAPQNGYEIVAYQGINGTVEGAANTAYTASSATILGPTTTTTIANDQIVEFFFEYNPAGLGANPPYSLTGVPGTLMAQINTNSNVMGAGGDYSKAVAGGTTADTLGWGGAPASTNTLAMVVAVEPAAALSDGVFLKNNTKLAGPAKID